MTKLATFIFLLTLIACSNGMKPSNGTINDTVHVVVYDRHGNIDWKTAKIFSKETSNNSIVFNYHDTSSIKKDTIPYDEKLTIFKNHDSIDFFGHICYLRDYKSYSIKNKSFKVYRYIYDELGVADEESEVYTNDSLGLVRYYSLCWGRTVTFIKDSIAYRLDKELRNDSSTFIRNKTNHDSYYKELDLFLKSRNKNDKR